MDTFSHDSMLQRSDWRIAEVKDRGRLRDLPRRGRWRVSRRVHRRLAGNTLKCTALSSRNRAFLGRDKKRHIEPWAASRPIPTWLNLLVKLRSLVRRWCSFRFMDQPISHFSLNQLVVLPDVPFSNLQPRCSSSNWTLPGWLPYMLSFTNHQPLQFN